MSPCDVFRSLKGLLWLEDSLEARRGGKHSWRSTWRPGFEAKVLTYHGMEQSWEGRPATETPRAQNLDCGPTGRVKGKSKGKRKERIRHLLTLSGQQRGVSKACASDEGR